MHKCTIPPELRSCIANPQERFAAFRPVFLTANGGRRCHLFYFNSLTGDLFLPDPEGEELPNIDSARAVAEQSAREALI